MPDIDVRTIASAISAFEADYQARGIDASTRRKYRTLTNQLRRFAEEHGFGYVSEFDLDSVTQFRATWTDGVRSAGKKLERLKALFRFCRERKWIAEDPAAALKPPVGANKAAKKYPFTDEELAHIYAACGRYGARRWHSGRGEGEVTGDELLTFILFSVETGLRISDAALFSADKLRGREVLLRATKNGEEIWTLISDELAARLTRLPLRKSRYFFLRGSSERLETVTDLWRRKIERVFEMVQEAGYTWPQSPTPHRFRHTFFRILLQNGVQPHDVAVLAGDKEETIRKHYSRWVPERQDRITGIMRGVWERQRQVQTRAGALRLIEGGKKTVNE